MAERATNAAPSGNVPETDVERVAWELRQVGKHGWDHLAKLGDVRLLLELHDVRDAAKGRNRFGQLLVLRNHLLPVAQAMVDGLEEESADADLEAHVTADLAGLALVLRAVFQLSPRWRGMSLSSRRRQVQAELGPGSVSNLIKGLERRALERLASELIARQPAELPQGSSSSETGRADWTRLGQELARGAARIWWVRDAVLDIWHPMALVNATTLEGHQSHAAKALPAALWEYARTLVWWQTSLGELMSLSKAVEDWPGGEFAPEFSLLARADEATEAEREELVAALRANGVEAARRMLSVVPFDDREESLLRSSIIAERSEFGPFSYFLEDSRRGEELSSKWRTWVFSCECASADPAQPGEACSVHEFLDRSGVFLKLVAEKYRATWSWHD